MSCPLYCSRTACAPLGVGNSKKQYPAGYPVTLSRINLTIGCSTIDDYKKKVHYYDKKSR
jgi:hypothetical protein